MRRRTPFSLVLLLLLLAPMLAFAQDGATISGTVTDEEGEALVGANVFLQLTNLGAATDINGKYSFTVPAKAVRGQKIKLSARFIGYRTRTVEATLSGDMTQDFQLPVDVLNMDAIVVTGVVAETPKEKMAFSVGTISTEALEHVPAQSPENALRGKVAGVKVIRGVGQPGTSASVQLRAPTSINASGRSQDPLYIVDGVIVDPSVTGSPLTDIPAEDIEDIQVVKGAAGASLYGSRAANGVIVITTRRGDKLGLDQTKIRVRSELGQNFLSNKIDLNKSHGSNIATSS